MFPLADYASRGYNLVHNRLAPDRKRLSSLMLYATDMCDSGCKHCLIWAKRPVTLLSFETIGKIMQSECVHASTVVGLEGGEFLLHPEADRIMEWFSVHHKMYDLFSNCLRPDRLIEAVKKYKPHRLYISLDGDRDTYRYMRGKDGYDQVVRVIKELKGLVPIFVMFTLSPYNDFGDLRHVAEVCRENGVFLRVGIYNNIPFFDTIDNAEQSSFGQLKNEEVLTFRKAKELQAAGHAGAGHGGMEVARAGGGADAAGGAGAKGAGGFGEGDGGAGLAGGDGARRGIGDAERGAADSERIPDEVKEYSENYDYIKLYGKWRSGKLRLKCHSILDSVIVLPDGKVPVCQHLSTALGNVHESSLDEIFNSAASNTVQQYHSENCNQCWVSYHRKYDIILYRTMEKYFGKWATSKMLGYYKWDEDESLSYKQVMERD
jgi:MoaA/NifB/PqqE/SkfB family radical SAM enzyme